MTLSASPARRRHDRVASPFDGFYHRQTPPWHDRRSQAIALACGLAAGIAILSGALALIG